MSFAERGYDKVYNPEVALQQRYEQFDNIVAEKPQKFPDCHLTDEYIFFTYIYLVLNNRFVSYLNVE